MFGNIYGDPIFGFTPASKRMASLTPYYGYNRKLFPNLGGIRGELGSGSIGNIYSGPYYKTYNV